VRLSDLNIVIAAGLQQIRVWWYLVDISRCFFGYLVQLLLVVRGLLALSLIILRSVANSIVCGIFAVHGLLLRASDCIAVLAVWHRKTKALKTVVAGLICESCLVLSLVLASGATSNLLVVTDGIWQLHLLLLLHVALLLQWLLLLLLLDLLLLLVAR